MSIVVVPGQFHSVPHPAGKLANTLLSVAVAGLADPSRFRRGKQYLVQHAVGRLELEPGRLRATVSGSRATPYQVEVLVPVLAPFDNATSDALRQQLTRLTPQPTDLHTRCSCPDPEAPCKHAVAAVLALAAELVAQPRLLVQWRCQPSDSPRAQVGSRAKPQLRLVTGQPGAAADADSTGAPPTGPGSTNTRPANTGPANTGSSNPANEPTGNPRTPGRPHQPPPEPWADPEWVAFLGQVPLPQLEPVPHEPARTARTMAGNLDVGAVVRSALEALTIHR